MRRAPWITLTIAAATVAIHATGLDPALELSRTNVFNTQLWRIISGHLTHADTNHLLWDLLAFIILGSLVEIASRRLLIASLLASTAAISAAVLVGSMYTETYRGLSGIDTCLLIVAALLHWSRWPLAARLALIAIPLKIAFELLTGRTLFVRTLEQSGMSPVPLAHALGALSGLAVTLPAIANRSTPLGPQETARNPGSRAVSRKTRRPHARPSSARPSAIQHEPCSSTSPPL